MDIEITTASGVIQVTLEQDPQVEGPTTLAKFAEIEVHEAIFDYSASFGWKVQYIADRLAGKFGGEITFIREQPQPPVAEDEEIVY